VNLGVEALHQVGEIVLHPHLATQVPIQVALHVTLAVQVVGIDLV
jgi:hypothetical protein